MSKAVDSLDFWKKRIDTAVQEQYSVYVIDDERWKRISEIHKKICDDNVGGKVLDAGCGYGRASEWFKNYTGVDFSPDFVYLAKQKYPTKKFLEADLKALPFQDREFDWAICISIKEMVVVNLGGETWQVMEKELKRVARKVLILEYSEPERFIIL